MRLACQLSISIVIILIPFVVLSLLESNSTCCAMDPCEWPRFPSLMVKISSETLCNWRQGFRLIENYNGYQKSHQPFLMFRNRIMLAGDRFWCKVEMPNRVIATSNGQSFSWPVA
ncbi:Ketol-acid reductoisomerase [Fusarium oxysporum f. sp. albedinis]|nr:Ketol-acid reductoisomerase [Fusarium oxysporum f. sp. albedinis]